MDFNFDDLDSLEALRPKIRNVEYKGCTFYVRNLSASAEKQLYALTSYARMQDEKAAINLMNGMTRIMLMNGVVNAKGEPVFKNEKQYNKFIDAVERELVTLLENSINPASTTVQEEQEKQEEKKPSSV